MDFLSTEDAPHRKSKHQQVGNIRETQPRWANVSAIARGASHEVTIHDNSVPVGHWPTSARARARSGARNIPSKPLEAAAVNTNPLTCYRAKGFAATTSEPRVLGRYGESELLPALPFQSEALFPRSAIQCAKAQLSFLGRRLRRTGVNTVDVSWIDGCEPVICFRSS